MSDDLLEPGLLLFSPEASNDPAAAYETLRSQCPVTAGMSALAEGAKSWWVSRYDDVMYVLRHPETFSSAPDAVDIGQEHSLIPLQVDPPEHAKYRRLLDPLFSPRKMAELEPEVRALVAGMIDDFAASGSCDFHEAVATPLPSTVFLALMGMPQSDLPTFLKWRDDTIRPDVEPGDFEGAQRIRDETGAAITAYFEAAIEHKRANPADDLLTQLVNAEIEGRPITHAELLGTCHLFLIAGLDTVTATLDCMVHHLATHPEQQAQLRDDPSLLDAAVEDMLRRETPVMMVARVIKHDVEFGGMQMKAGDSLAPVLGAANTDSGEFDDANDVRFDRTGNRHLAFGAGPHRCLGSHLARMELRVALDEFHKRVPQYTVAADANIQFSPAIRQTNDGLPLVW